MASTRERAISIRRCTPTDYELVGRMIVQAYAALPGMPQPDEQPDYYAMLANVGKRDGNPSIRVFVAVDEHDEPVGSIDFVSDMKQYGAAGAASSVDDAAGIRLLAVRADWRGAGIGKGLTRFCIEHARTLRKSKVILHTTRVMQTAWSMYERMGFVRYPDIDFQQQSLFVYGFKLPLAYE
jgi:GNAT superfamily N-acetyltransferase